MYDDNSDISTSFLRSLFFVVKIFYQNLSKLSLSLSNPRRRCNITDPKIPSVDVLPKIKTNTYIDLKG